MKKIIVVIDMQNDFIDGALGTPDAVKIVPNVCKKIENADCEVVFTMDTHSDDYMSTREGKKLPIPHCIKPSFGWELHPEIKKLSQDKKTFEKTSFTSIELAEYVKNGAFDTIELLGLCTDICVVANALLIKAYLPEANIFVDSSCCAGVTPKAHQSTIEVLNSCQIDVI